MASYIIVEALREVAQQLKDEYDRDKNPPDKWDIAVVLNAVASKIERKITLIGREL